MKEVVDCIEWDSIESQYIDNCGNMYMSVEDIPKVYRHLVKPISNDTPTNFRAKPITSLPQLKPKQKETITVDGLRYCLDSYYERLNEVNKHGTIMHEYKFKKQKNKFHL
jgi:hypothetical protein